MVLLFVKPILLLCEHWLLHIESMFFFVRINNYSNLHKCT